MSKATASRRYAVVRLDTQPPRIVADGLAERPEAVADATNRTSQLPAARYRVRSEAGLLLDKAAGRNLEWER